MLRGADAPPPPSLRTSLGRRAPPPPPASSYPRSLDPSPQSLSGSVSQSLDGLVARRYNALRSTVHYKGSRALCSYITPSYVELHSMQKYSRESSYQRQSFSVRSNKHAIPMSSPTNPCIYCKRATVCIVNGVMRSADISGLLTAQECSGREIPPSVYPSARPSARPCVRPCVRP